MESDFLKAAFSLNSLFNCAPEDYLDVRSLQHNLVQTGVQQGAEIPGYNQSVHGEKESARRGKSSRRLVSSPYPFLLNHFLAERIFVTVRSSAYASADSFQSVVPYFSHDSYSCPTAMVPHFSHSVEWDSVRGSVVPHFSHVSTTLVQQHSAGGLA
jgi:hypothetical protein